MGVKERKIREKEIRRKEILKAAGKLFSGKRGMEATMDDLAELTELGKGTLYLYFPNKENILQALAGKGIGLLRKRLGRTLDDSKTGIEQLSVIGDIFIDFLKEKPFYARLILKFEQKMVHDDRTGEEKLLVEPVLEILKNILEKGKNDGSLRDDISTYELVTILWSQMLGIIHTLAGRKHILDIYHINEEWIVKGHYRIIMRGLMPKND